VVQVSLWVMTQIVTGAEVKDRAKTISKFVNAAKVIIYTQRARLPLQRAVALNAGPAQELRFIFVSFLAGNASTEQLQRHHAAPVGPQQLVHSTTHRRVGGACTNETCLPSRAHLGSFRAQSLTTTLSLLQLIWLSAVGRT
jgi:hypothetical protein